MLKVKCLNRITKDLPLNASALIEERFNHKNNTIIFIKDSFRKFIYDPIEIEINFKGGIIKNRNTVSAHLIFQVRDNFNEKYYPFHFNYFNENSLKLLYNLTKQKEVYIVFGDEENKYMPIAFHNNIGVFLKKYIKTSIEYGYRWSDNEYKESLIEVIESFKDIRDLWDRLGDEVYMERIEDYKNNHK